MLKFFSNVLCTSKIHQFSLGNYLGTSLIFGNLVIIKIISVEWILFGGCCFGMRLCIRL